MITLEQLLDGLEVSMGPLATHPLRGDGTVDYGQMDGPAIHYALRGSARLEIAEGVTVSVSARTVILAPPGRRTRIAINGGRRTDVVIACIPVCATYRGSVGLFDHLHEPLVARVGVDDPVRRSFEELLDEIDAHRPGGRAMSEALLRRCLIWLLRHCFERGEGRYDAWLAPLEDTRLGRALTAMHDRPQHGFSLPELAELAGMSRSVFAARFAHAVGQSPIEFLKALRLALAAELLTRTDLPVKGIAARVGYSSRSSFTRAFCARHGLAPAEFRTAGRPPLAKTA
jgi:AraC-like DNA-binding protein